MLQKTLTVGCTCKHQSPCLKPWRWLCTAVCLVVTAIAPLLHARYAGTFSAHLDATRMIHRQESPAAFSIRSVCIKLSLCPLRV